MLCVLLLARPFTPSKVYVWHKNIVQYNLRIDTCEKKPMRVIYNLWFLKFSLLS